MKIFIVEDEELAVKKLKKTLQTVDEDATVVGEADSIKSSVNWLENNPDPEYGDGVVTPHASFLAMMFERGQATANLRMASRSSASCLPVTRCPSISTLSPRR